MKQIKLRNAFIAMPIVAVVMGTFAFRAWRGKR